MRNHNFVSPLGLKTKFCLEIGGLQIVLKFPRNAKNRKQIRSEEDADRIIFHIHQGFIPEINDKTKVFDSDYVWSLFTSGGRFYLQDVKFSSPWWPQTLIRFAPDLDGGEIYLKKRVRDESVFKDLFGYPLNQLLIITLLFSRGGVLVHACGIDDGGRGYLFLGNSTHGKTTMAKLWHQHGASVINDDRIIVREKNGSFLMYGTPWHGTFTETSSKTLPIEKIFFLNHGRQNLLKPKTGSQAVSMFLTRSFPPFWDPKGMKQVLKLIENLTRAVPCFELHFVPNESVVDFIRHARD